ncbi:probable ATP-dependent RNA helicase DDX52 [Phymastichus coffea]|uniref:probable ATP-dependent RNA helicase DDX52 n=1 Tax=Phymastichus coffea TaxID=108790 RepID=UPI00273B8F16|nr:probable ATP-dependent RNA helicase DDX52 [Phymastichus coffea]
MDAYDIFKTLSFGIKYDLKRFPSDAERFSLVKKHSPRDLLKVNEESDDVEKSKRNIVETGSSEEIVKYSKRKHDDNDENEKPKNVLTLLDGISAVEDGTIIRPKKKSKIMTEDKKLKLEQEKINQYRNQHHISVTGSHVPVPIKSFEELFEIYNVKSDILQNMKNCGYTEPTPIQMQAMPVMLQGRQILACAPTGSGKTAAFLLPIIHHLIGPQKKGFRAVIISPTRELAKQTYSECMRMSEGRGFRVHIISKIKQALTQYGPKSNQKYDILITTPKRVVFLLNQDPPAISLNNVEWLVVDEADKLFEESTRGFKEQLQEISKACTNPNIHYAMFSATNTPVLTKWCRHNLKGLVTITVGHRNATADTIEQELLFVGCERGKLIEIRNIIQKGLNPPVLIFVDTKARAEELFKELIYDGINVDMIHAERTQTQRDNVVRCFREGKIWVLICTEMMARGIDFKDVNLVINYDFPKSAISYIHRIGRTGRAGRKGKAITFFTQDDAINLRSIATKMREAGCEVPDYMLAMKKISKKQRRKLELAHQYPAIGTNIIRKKKENRTDACKKNV